MSLRPLPGWLPCVLLALLSWSFAPVVAAEEDETTVEQLKQDTQELGRTLKYFSADQKDQAIASINETLKALDARIGQLEKELAENWEDMSELTRERTRKSIESLQEQRSTVAEWYDRLKNSSVSAWDRMKKGFSDAYDDLSESWEEAEEDMSEGDAERRQDSI